MANPHEVGTWLMLISVHLRRAQDALASADHPGGALDALRKVLAIGTACGEQHGLPARRAQVSSPLGRGNLGLGAIRIGKA